MIPPLNVIIVSVAARSTITTHPNIHTGTFYTILNLHSHDKTNILHQVCVKYDEGNER